MTTLPEFAPEFAPELDEHFVVASPPSAPRKRKDVKADELNKDDYSIFNKWAKTELNLTKPRVYDFDEFASYIYYMSPDALLVLQFMLRHIDVTNPILISIPIEYRVGRHDQHRLDEIIAHCHKEPAYKDVLRTFILNVLSSRYLVKQKAAKASSANVDLDSDCTTTDVDE